MWDRSLVCLATVSYLLFCSSTTGPWASPELEKLNATGGIFDGKLTTEQASWIGSLATLGGVVGTILGGLLVENIGRKITLLAAALPLVVSYFVLAFSRDIFSIYVARTMAGLPIGITCAALPIYAGEIAKNEHRGSITGMYSFLVHGGNIVTYAAGPYMSYSSFNLMLAIFPMLYILLFLFLGVESPHYLIKRGQNDKAKATLEKIRNHSAKKQVEDEFNYLKILVDHEEKGTVMELFRHKGTQKAMIMVLGLFTFYNFSGTTALLTYTQQIFIISGASIPSEQCAILTGTIQLLSGTVVPFIINKLGRKSLVLISTICTAVGNAMLGTSFLLHDQGFNLPLLKFFPMVSVVFTITSCSIGMGTIPMIFTSEIFPNRVKGSAAALATCYSFLASFTVAKFFPILNKEFGSAPVFFGFSAVCLAAIPFDIFYVKETKGKNLKEILDMFNK